MSSRSPHLTIFKTGDTAPEVIAAHGDYDTMFRAVLEPLGVECEVIDAHRGAVLPTPEDVDMALITGSPASVTTPEPWVEALADWARRAQAAAVPQLGVCYGHQLLAYAHGGRVEQSTRGMEIGTTRVELSAAGREDPLLAGLADARAQVDFHQVHGDVVTALPEGAVLLASNPHTELQAFRLGDKIWGVQFHPEFTRPIMDMYVEARADRVRGLAADAGLDPEAELSRARASITDAPQGPRLLARFIELATAG